MRILSPFRDYYDSCQSIAMEKTLVWTRETRQEVSHRQIFPKNLNQSLRIKSNVFTFADRMFDKENKVSIVVKPSLLIWGFKRSKVLNLTSYKQEFSYRLNGTLIEDCFPFSSADEVFEFLRRSGCSSKFVKQTCNQIKEWFDESLDEKEIESLQSRLQAPIVYLDTFSTSVDDNSYKQVNYRITGNPSLAEYSLVKVLDAFQLFQEISMWVNAKNNIEKEAKDLITNATEKEKLNQHGFHSKSFKHRK